jgi:outer membrane protein assembly factor BamA
MAWDRRVCREFDYSRRGDICAPGQGVNVEVGWSRQADDDPYLVRAPVYSYGIGLRINIFYTVLRLDYAWPVSRDRGGVFSLGFGPSF